MLSLGAQGKQAAIHISAGFVHTAGGFEGREGAQPVMASSARAEMAAGEDGGVVGSGLCEGRGRGGERQRVRRSTVRQEGANQ